MHAHQDFVYIAFAEEKFEPYSFGTWLDLEIQDLRAAFKTSKSSPISTFKILQFYLMLRR